MYRQSQMYTHGTSNRDLGLQRMVKIRLPLPPRETQETIVQQLDAVVDARRSAASRAKITEHRDRELLNRVMSRGEERQ